AKKIDIGRDFVFEILSKRIAVIAQEKKLDPQKVVNVSIEKLQKLMKVEGIPVKEVKQGEQQQVVPSKEQQEQLQQPPLRQEVVDYINTLTEKNFNPEFWGFYIKESWLQ